MKYAFVTSVSPGYMFALNCNFNSNKFYGTNADFVVLHSYMDTPEEVEYRKKCESAFPFKIDWRNMHDYSTCFHNSKYAVAKALAEEYDVICLIDSDLFICCDTMKYFETAHFEKKLISAEHEWSGGNVDRLFSIPPERVNDRNEAQIADFPVFVDPKIGKPMFERWKFNTENGPEVGDWRHPLVAFNRALVENFKRNQVDVLDGHLWVCDMNFWDADYTEGIDTDGRICIDTNHYGHKQQAMALHNKWWKPGRANGEWLGHRNIPATDVYTTSKLDRGERNFNTIKNFMAKFNDMTPETKRTDYLQEKIDRKAFLSTWKPGDA